MNNNRLKSFRKSVLIFLSLLAFTPVVPFPVFANEVMLPNYRAEAKKYNLRLCDERTTKIILYRNGGMYYITEAETKSGDTFLMFFDATGGGAHFLLKSTDEKITELTQTEWYEKIKLTAPNYFWHIRGEGTSDCFEAERYRQ